MEVAKEQGVSVRQGIYVMSGGPQYESSAEIAFYKAIGCDALGNIFFPTFKPYELSFDAAN